MIYILRRFKKLNNFTKSPPPYTCDCASKGAPKLGKTSILANNYDN